VEFSQLDPRTLDTLRQVKNTWQRGQEKSGHPADWARKKADIKLWSKQKDICTSVMENKKTAAKAGHGVGKSLSAAVIADWWIDSHPVGEAFVVSTAPSTPQIHAILWAEMLKIHTKGGLPGEIQLSDNWIIGKTLVGQGRKPHDYNKHAFQGIHRRFVLAILDEACGIPEWLWDAVETITTGEHCRILAIGNPDDPSSHFAKVCKPGSGWNTITISVLDSPNFTDEEVDDDVRDMLTARAWVEDKRNSWGEESPIWQSKILGEFPVLDEYAVIPLVWVQAAQQRYKEWMANGCPPIPGRKVIGADIARYGADQTVFAHRQGNLCSKLEKYRKLSTEVTADLLMQRVDLHEGLAVVDVIGIGAGVVDKLLRNKFPTRAFNAAARTNATDKTGEWGFPTLRSAAWWNMRQLLDPSMDSDVMLPDDEDLAAELIAPRWQIQVGAKIYVESKDDIKKRIGRSTDLADAVIMAFWVSSGVWDEDAETSFHWTDQNIPDGAIGWEENLGLMAELGFDRPDREAAYYA
jgi:hypothetical protein